MPTESQALTKTPKAPTLLLGKQKREESPAGPSSYGYVSFSYCFEKRKLRKYTFNSAPLVLVRRIFSAAIPAISLPV